MKKILLAAVVLGFSSFVFAQDEPPTPPPAKDNKSEEIIIRNKGDKKMDMTIQINGDSIIINGKPLSEFKDDDITINKRKIMIHGKDRMMSFDFNNDFDNDFNLENFPGMDGKEITKPFLGVTTEKVKDGVKITEVVKASAAEKAGLKEGDVITKIDEDKIDDPETLSKVIKAKKPKAEIKISYRRDKKEKTLKATLGEWKEKKTYAYSFNGPMMHSFQIPGVPPVPNMDENDDDAPYIPELSIPRQKKIGLKIQDTEDNKVKVIDVDDSSAAAKAGIRKDDIITEIDGEKINNTDEAREQLHPEEGKNSYNIKVNRNGTEMNVEVKIPKKLKTADL